MKSLTRLLSGLALLTAASAAHAETYRLVAPDGTVHFTNVPTDPHYQRMGVAVPAVSGPVPPARPDTSPYAREILDAASRYGVPAGLISSVIRVESAFNPYALSRRGALGLMQLMPETAAMLGVRNVFDPRENIDGGVRHLRDLLDRFAHDLRLALAAYNAGVQAVLAWGGIPPYPETQEYVTRVLRLFGQPAAPPPSLPRSTYRVVEADGTVVYTNIPPRRRL